MTGGATARAAARWSDAATWEGEGLRREVFFFPSRGVQLYASLYAAAEPSRAPGLVFCYPWGMEADRCSRLAHALALKSARLGGAGLIFHYPGYGDSHGDPRAVTLDALVEAAVDATRQAAGRRPGTRWVLSGLTLGAAIACLAQAQLGAHGLLLLQPALRPGAYFADLAARARRSVLSARSDDIVYGYPLTELLVDSALAADSGPVSLLGRFSGDGAIVRYAEPPPAEPTPSGLEEIEVPGTWRFGARDHVPLRAPVTRWLKRQAAREAASP